MTNIPSLFPQNNYEASQALRTPQANYHDSHYFISLKVESQPQKTVKIVFVFLRIKDSLVSIH